MEHVIEKLFEEKNLSNEEILQVTCRILKDIVGDEMIIIKKQRIALLIVMLSNVILALGILAFFKIF